MPLTSQGGQGSGPPTCVPCPRCGDPRGAPRLYDACPNCGWLNGYQPVGATLPLIPDDVFLSEEPEPVIGPRGVKIGLGILVLVGSAIVYFAFGEVSPSAGRWIFAVAVAIAIVKAVSRAARRRARGRQEEGVA